MNSDIPLNENTEKYIAEIRSLYKEANFKKAVLMLGVFKRVPEELHEIATDAIIRTANISHLCYVTGLGFLTWKSGVCL